MAVPPLRELLEPLLRVLADAPQGLTSRQSQDGVADLLQLSIEDRSLRVPGGKQVLFRHRTNWAHDRLKRAQLSSTPRKGVWQLTDAGMKLARSSTQPLTKETIREVARADRNLRTQPARSEAPDVEPRLSA